MPPPRPLDDAALAALGRDWFAAIRRDAAAAEQREREADERRRPRNDPTDGGGDLLDDLFGDGDGDGGD